MERKLFSKTESLELHTKRKEALKAYGIVFQEEVKTGFGIKEMLFQFFVFQRATSGVRRNQPHRLYMLWLEEGDYEKAKAIERY